MARPSSGVLRSAASFMVERPLSEGLKNVASSPILKPVVSTGSLTIADSLTVMDRPRGSPPRPPALLMDAEPAARKRTSMVYQQQQRLNQVLGEEKVDWEEVRKYAFVKGLDPNKTDRETLVNTAHRSAYAGEAKVLRWCLQKGADVNARTSMGRSALHYACDGNAPACIRVLLQFGADVNLCTLSSLTPLHICCSWNHLPAVVELLGSGINDGPSLPTTQLIDVDARAREDACLAEELATDPRIVEAVQKYRETLHEKKKSDLLERAVLRLFRLYDRSGRHYVMPEEWADSYTLLAQHLSPKGGAVPVRISEEAFRVAEQRFDSRVSWEEFREAHLELVKDLGASLRYVDLMTRLRDLEGELFQEAVKATLTLTQEGERPSSAPMQTPRGREMAARRAAPPAKRLRCSSLRARSARNLGA